MTAVPSILIVDDKPANLVALRSVLAPLEANVVQALRGDDALRLTLHQDFALAILDVQMPQMDGYELAQLMRGDLRTRNIPIIFLSAIYSDAMHQFKGYQSGAVDFITKPFNPDVLLSKVRVFLELYEHAQKTLELNKRLELFLVSQERVNKELGREIAIRLQAEAELKQAKETAEQAWEEWERTFDAVPDLIALIDTNHCLLRVNKSMAERVGGDSGQIVGMRCHELVHGMAEPPDFCPHAKLLKSGREEHCEFFDENLGSAFDVSTTPIRDTAGNIICSVHVMRDITERRRNEELRDHIERIIQHDLRSPASNAVNIASMLRSDDNLTDDQHRLLGYLENAGMQMLHTLNSSLDLYKIETGRYDCTIETINALELLKDVVATLPQVHQAVYPSIEIIAEAASGGEMLYLCQGESKLLRTALQNLLENAREASPSSATVSVRLPADGGCRIEIRNKGVVPPDIRERFFEKYVTRGKTSGTGIGTYSAKMMITAQGGEITMRTSDAEDETVVTVRLPN